MTYPNVQLLINNAWRAARGEATIDAGREHLGWVLFHEAWERVERWLR